MRGKQIVTTGLAAVATIHAAHEVYQSMEKRNARHKAVKEGRLSEGEAKKLKTKAIMQDAASVGIAALGIKGAISEMKEAKHLTHECNEFKEEKARRHEKRMQKRMRKQNGDGTRRAESWAPSSRVRNDGYDSDLEYDQYDPRDYGGNPYRGNVYPAEPPSPILSQWLDARRSRCEPIRPVPQSQGQTQIPGSSARHDTVAHDELFNPAREDLTMEEWSTIWNELPDGKTGVRG
ncbi:hypothetical protein NM208_g16358 [Fusarium decemcellulare]|uniref:Uncharacterized protein n=1 Tax=Fusarium decemcellulare TaxID=57161 RepID=A0ACC1RC62_9HYPO|nr:hypothetical protein NM208_g16358 [Fusarium decemcellulare]